jgi:hypothetical protein
MNTLPGTGNDIVALSATDRERTILPRFYSRILDAREQTLYDQQALQTLPFDNYVWLLWSIKESVYKYKQRASPELVFSPTKIPVREVLPPSGDGFYRATISYGPIPLYSRSVIRDNMIATVVSENENFENTHWGFEKIDHSGYAHQSSTVRELAVNQLNSTLSRDHLRIGKSPAGYPIVLDGEEQLEIPVSLAHHDRWVAWSFVLPVPQFAG